MLVKTKFWDSRENTKNLEEKHNHPFLLCIHKVVEKVEVILIALTLNFPEAASEFQALLSLNSYQPLSLFPPSEESNWRTEAGVSHCKLGKCSRSWVSNTGNCSNTGSCSSNYNSNCVYVGGCHMGVRNKTRKGSFYCSTCIVTDWNQARSLSGSFFFFFCIF